MRTEATSAFRSIRMRSLGTKGASLIHDLKAVFSDYVIGRHNDTNIKGGMTIYYTEKDFSSDGDQYITGFAPVR